MKRFTFAIGCVMLLWCVAVVAGLAPRQQSAGAQERKAAAAKFEVYKDRSGEYRWRLRAQNSQVLATSGDGYTEKRSCLAAIDSVRRNAADAPVEELAEAPKE